MTNKKISAEPEGTTSNKLVQLEMPQKSNNARYSLTRLEEELGALHAKWQSIEQELSERDRHILQLEGELENHENMRGSFEAEIAAIRTERETLVDNLQRVQKELAELQEQGATHESKLLDRDADIEALRREQQALQAQKSTLEKALEDERESHTSAGERYQGLDAENARLRVEIDELKHYIDGRKKDWHDLQAQIREYEDTIDGINRSLGGHNEILAQKEDEKAALAGQVMDLEKKLAALEGRHEERKARQSEMQQTLDDQSRELGSLNGETISLRKEAKKAQEKLKRRDDSLKSIRGELKKSKSEAARLNKELTSEKADIKALRTKLDTAEERIKEFEAEKKERITTVNQLGETITELRERIGQSEPAIGRHESRITDLESVLQKSEERVEELKSELKLTKSELSDVRTKAIEHEKSALEIKAELKGRDSEKKDLLQELEAQQELVAVLEHELSTKQENLDFLDRSVDRLSAIGSGIRQLDVQINEHRSEPLNGYDKEANGETTDFDQLFLSPEELFSDEDDVYDHLIVSEDDGLGKPARYPLMQKEVTIGRSRKSDIRINSKYISRLHARIRVEGKEVTIEDAGSTNGFLVNSKHSLRHTLKHGDKLEIGKSRFHYIDRSAQQSAKS